MNFIIVFQVCSRCPSSLTMNFSMSSRKVNASEEYSFHLDFHSSGACCIGKLEAPWLSGRTFFFSLMQKITVTSSGSFHSPQHGNSSYSTAPPIACV